MKKPFIATVATISFILMLVLSCGEDYDDSSSKKDGDESENAQNADADKTGPDWYKSWELARKWHKTIIFKDKVWIIGGFQQASPDLFKSLCRNDVFYSDDMINWKKVKSPPWKPRVDFGCAVWKGKIWVIGGRDQEKSNYIGIGFSDIWSTVDGENWKYHGSFQGCTAYYASLAVDTKTDTLYMYATMTGSELIGFINNALWKTKDGLNWETVYVNHKDKFVPERLVYNVSQMEQSLRTNSYSKNMTDLVGYSLVSRYYSVYNQGNSIPAWLFDYPNSWSEPLAVMNSMGTFNTKIYYVSRKPDPNKPGKFILYPEEHVAQRYLLEPEKMGTSMTTFIGDPNIAKTRGYSLVYNNDYLYIIGPETNYHYDIHGGNDNTVQVAEGVWFSKRNERGKFEESSGADRDFSVWWYQPPKSKTEDSIDFDNRNCYVSFGKTDYWQMFRWDVATPPNMPELPHFIALPYYTQRMVFDWSQHWTERTDSRILILSSGKMIIYGGASFNQFRTNFNDGRFYHVGDLWDATYSYTYNGGINQYGKLYPRGYRSTITERNGYGEIPAYNGYNYYDMWICDVTSNDIPDKQLKRWKKVYPAEDFKYGRGKDYIYSDVQQLVPGRSGHSFVEYKGYVYALLGDITYVYNIKGWPNFASGLTDTVYRCPVNQIENANAWEKYHVTIDVGKTGYYDIKTGHIINSKTTEYGWINMKSKPNTSGIGP